MCGPIITGHDGRLAPLRPGMPRLRVTQSLVLDDDDDDDNSVTRRRDECRQVLSQIHGSRPR
jgi:hypothetical protein